MHGGAVRPDREWVPYRIASHSDLADAPGKRSAAGPEKGDAGANRRRKSVVAKNPSTSALPPDWVQARKRYRLSERHVQMARELGMNPKKLGGLDNHRQEPWKAPLPEFIEGLYAKRYGAKQPSR